ncbi:MAG: hypothetical protein GY743_10375, partial [Planctomycetaceae bacterium]|nr:hypothetical protein [Planctomycetaceae bacterium]
MPISKELLLSILAMDSYNQGYDAGIEHGKSQIGNAIFDDDKGDAEAKAAGFYAVSYKITDGSSVDGLDTNDVIISYRGTDDPLGEASGADIWN